MSLPRTRPTRRSKASSASVRRVGPELEIDPRHDGFDELHRDAGGRLDFLAHRAAQVVHHLVHHREGERDRHQRDHEIDAKAQAHGTRKSSVARRSAAAISGPVAE
jgi:hypothetical protein